jgi:thymidylate synthase
MDEEDFNIPISVLIEGKDMANAWAKEINLLSLQPYILAGEDYKGNAIRCRDMNVLVVLDKAAVAKIRKGEMHPAYESRKFALDAYDYEFTYDFVYSQWKAADLKKFVYNYFDRFVNKPMPDEKFIYQGAPYVQDPEAAKYINKETGGLDQIRWLHDAIREQGISRRHQIITWIEAIDCFAQSPPCLQRIIIRVLVPKSEWHKYKGRIPVEVHIEYRSWDIGRAQLSNLYGLVRMLYRYILGNLTAETEYIRDAEGNKIKLNDEGNKVEFEIESLKLFGDFSHYYEDWEDVAKTVRPISSLAGGKK